MTRTESKIAIVVLALVAASFALIFQGMRVQGTVGRITALRTWPLAGAEQVALVFDNALHVLDASGRRLARQPLAELSLTEEPTDMDWVTAPDGSVQAWFFEDTTPRIVRCTLDAATQRLGRCRQVLAGAALKANPRSITAHLAVDAQRQIVFVADAQGHEVRALGLDGQRLASSAPGLLYYPNRLRLAGDGQLIVADNDHHRLVWLDIAAPQPSLRPGRVLAAGAHPQARPGTTKVTDLALRDGALWMLAVAQGQKHGDVLVYGDPLAPVARASLGGGDPLAIDVLGQAALVADFDGIDLYRVGRAGEFLGPFGDAALRGELAQARRAATHARWWTWGGWAGFALTLVAGFVLALRHGQKPAAWSHRVPVGAAPGAAFDDPPPGPDVVLAPAPWFLRQMRLALWAGPVLTLLAAGILWAILPPRVGPLLGSRAGLQLIASVALLGIALVVSTVLAWRFTARRLVIGAGGLRIEAGDKVLAAAALADVLVSPVSLLVGATVLPYRQALTPDRPGKWIYDEAPLQQHLFARLRPEQSVTLGQLQRAILRRLPLRIKLLLGLLVLTALALALWPLLRPWLPG